LVSWDGGAFGVGARPSQEFAGLVLGLSIVSAIATAHGATPAVQPQPAGGLRVEVRFPAVNARPGGGAT
jgi:signal transduction histidine kinase